MLMGRLPAPTIVSAYTSTLADGRQIVTFHAERELPRDVVNGKRVDAVTVVVGWLSRRGPSPFTLVDAQGSQSSRYGESAARLLIPRAALTVDGRTFWIGNQYGYEGEAYVVIEIANGTPTLTLEAAAGGC